MGQSVSKFTPGISASTATLGTLTKLPTTFAELQTLVSKHFRAGENHLKYQKFNRPRYKKRLHTYKGLPNHSHERHRFTRAPVVHHHTRQRYMIEKPKMMKLRKSTPLQLYWYEALEVNVLLKNRKAISNTAAALNHKRKRAKRRRLGTVKGSRVRKYRNRLADLPFSFRWRMYNFANYKCVDQATPTITEHQGKEKLPDEVNVKVVCKSGRPRVMNTRLKKAPSKSGRPKVMKTHLKQKPRKSGRLKEHGPRRSSSNWVALGKRGKTTDKRAVQKRAYIQKWVEGWVMEESRYLEEQPMTTISISTTRLPPATVTQSLGVCGRIDQKRSEQMELKTTIEEIIIVRNQDDNRENSEISSNTPTQDQLRNQVEGEGTKDSESSMGGHGAQNSGDEVTFVRRHNDISNTTLKGPTMLRAEEFLSRFAENREEEAGLTSLLQGLNVVNPQGNNNEAYNQHEYGAQNMGEEVPVVGRHEEASGKSSDMQTQDQEQDQVEGEDTNDCSGSFGGHGVQNIGDEVPLVRRHNDISNTTLKSPTMLRAEEFLSRFAENREEEAGLTSLLQGLNVVNPQGNNSKTYNEYGYGAQNIVDEATVVRQHEETSGNSPNTPTHDEPQNEVEAEGIKDRIGSFGGHVAQNIGDEVPVITVMRDYEGASGNSFNTPTQDLSQNEVEAEDKKDSNDTLGVSTSATIPISLAMSRAEEFLSQFAENREEEAGLNSLLEGLNVVNQESNH
ncbi:hypothetical protein EV426DRAFT_699697 [Tirmania nivea]|nr:hypothetical protein EV426DRAFT_699697 [Tirmania nivea]